MNNNEVLIIRHHHRYHHHHRRRRRRLSFSAFSCSSCSSLSLSVDFVLMQHLKSRELITVLCIYYLQAEGLTLVNSEQNISNGHNYQKLALEVELICTNIQ